MKISIVNGVSKVEFLASEVKALQKSVDLCNDLAKWLNDENAKTTAGNVATVLADYLPE